jgi:phage terminase large subunit GpA-like protein
VGIKVVETSTPTDELGLITKAFKAGSQHLYNVPCWKCEKPFVHVFSKETLWVPAEAKGADGSYDLDMIEEEARYVCPHCKEKLADKYRDRMIAAGEWKQTNFKAPKNHRSAHISGFISPTITYGRMAREFFEKKNSANGLRDYHNNYLGLPFTPKAVTNSGETIKTLISKTPISYKRGELPFEPYVIITSVDVQQRSFWFIKMAYDEFGNAWVIDWGELPSYKSIIEEIEKAHVFNDVEYFSGGGLIDSGYEAKRENGVYAFCQKSNGRFHPVKGWAESQARFKTLEFKDFDHNGLAIRLYNINDGFFKSELYGTRMKGLGAEMLCLPQNPDNHLIDQLTDERLVPVAGKMVWESEDKDNPNNHLGDCAKYNLAAWSHLNPNAQGEDEKN